MSSFRCGCERGEDVSGGRAVVVLVAAAIPGSSVASPGRHVPARPGGVPRARGRIGGAAARLRAAAQPSGGTRVLPRGRRVNGSLRRSGRPASVCVFVPCSLWFSLLPCFWVWLLLTVCGPSRRRPFRVEQSRREPGCRPVGLRRNGAAFARSRPVLRGTGPRRDLRGCCRHRP